MAGKQAYAEVTEDWSLRQAGIDYNQTLTPPYYETIAQNERFYAGDQWHGVQANGLPKPVFNQFKRIVNHFVSSMMAQKVTTRITALNSAKDSTDIIEMLAREVTSFANDSIQELWEENKLDSLLRQALFDMALTGDAGMYSYMDMSKNKRNEKETDGKVACELVDPSNVFFGNPNDARVQTQPYIILTFRRLVGEIKREAKARGTKKEIIDRISGDDDTMYQSGDRSQRELENVDEAAKATVVLKMWKEWDDEGTCRVYFRKSTSNVCFVEKTDTKLRIYPFAWTSWDSRKGSYHGQSPCTGLTPNQIFINKLFAMMMVSLMNTAFPRLVYDKGAISAPSNAIGQVYGVNGDVSKAMTYLNGAQQSGNVMGVIDAAIKYTKDMLGALDAFMGDIRPENKSAIIAVTKNASIPLENVKANLYQFVEDNVLVWLDMMRAYYGERQVVRHELGMDVKKGFDFSAIGSVDLSVRVDVGASSYWSEIGTLQTLDSMLSSNMISPLQYLERIPDTIFPNKSGLIEELRAGDKTKQVLYYEMWKFVSQLPEEQQQAIRNMPAEKMEAAVLDMMMARQQQEKGQMDMAPSPMGGAMEAGGRSDVSMKPNAGPGSVPAFQQY